MERPTRQPAGKLRLLTWPLVGFLIGLIFVFPPHGVHTTDKEEYLAQIFALTIFYTLIALVAALIMNKWLGPTGTILPFYNSNRQQEWIFAVGLGVSLVLRAIPIVGLVAMAVAALPILIVMRGNVFGRSKPRDDAPIEPAFARIDRVLTNEAEQNRLMPDAIRQKLERGESCDTVKGAEGEFGRSHKNPIPVNGPIGEVLYLSSLETKDGCFLFAHRLGAIEGIDVFETVTSDGSLWDILFFDLYHPRKSKLAPNGYFFRSHGAGPIISATNQTVAEFPGEMRGAISEWSKSTLGMPIASKEIRLALERVSFARPDEFKSLVDILPLDGRVPHLPDQRLILAQRHVSSQAVAIEAILQNKIGCGTGDRIESIYFALASLTYAYLRYGPADRNTGFAEEFQKYVLADSISAELSFQQSISKYQVRYKEYWNLMDEMFPKEGGFSEHDMITLMLHVTETISGVSARSYMLRVAGFSSVLAAMFQDSVDFAKSNLK